MRSHPDEPQPDDTAPTQPVLSDPSPTLVCVLSLDVDPIDALVDAEYDALADTQRMPSIPPEPEPSDAATLGLGAGL